MTDKFLLASIRMELGANAFGDSDEDLTQWLVEMERGGDRARCGPGPDRRPPMTPVRNGFQRFVLNRRTQTLAIAAYFERTCRDAPNKLLFLPIRDEAGNILARGSCPYLANFCRRAALPLWFLEQGRTARQLRETLLATPMTETPRGLDRMRLGRSGPLASIVVDSFRDKTTRIDSESANKRVGPDSTEA